MKPSDELILAWKEYLTSVQVGDVACIKSVAMFKYSVTKTGIDAELYNRAAALNKHGGRVKAHAQVVFRAALKKAYDKRWRIEWRDRHTCTVWVHERYEQKEESLHFNKSLRCRKRLT